MGKKVRSTDWTLEAWIQHAKDLREDDQRALEIKQKADEEALDFS